MSDGEEKCEDCGRPGWEHDGGRPPRYGKAMTIDESVARALAATRGDAMTALRVAVERAKAAEREMDEFALAVGYGERPEGQGGVHRLSGPELAEKWRELHRDEMAATDRAGQHEKVLRSIYNGDCEETPQWCGACQQCLIHAALGDAEGGGA